MRRPSVAAAPFLAGAKQMELNAKQVAWLDDAMTKHPDVPPEHLLVIGCGGMAPTDTTALPAPEHQQRAAEVEAALADGAQMLRDTERRNAEAVSARAV